MVNFHLLQQISLTFDKTFQQHREDISAILLTQEKHLWLGSDETATIERLYLVDGNKFSDHKQFRVAEFIDLPAPEDEEIDIEGLAYADNYLWFTGSHSYKRKNIKSDNTDEKNISRLAKVTSEDNRYILGRIPLVNGKLLQSCPDPQDANKQLVAAKLELIKQGNVLMSALADDPHLGFFVKAAIPGKDNGFDVEGLAVYENKIFLGLRGPVLRGWAIILEIELQDSQPGLMRLWESGKGGKTYKKHFVWLNGLGIRDLCLAGKDLLILAGPTMDLDGPVQVYRIENGVNLQENILNRPELVQEIPYGDRNDHAEGITLFEDVSGVPSILVVYDSPAKSRLVGNDSVIADVFPLG
ncbi:DUF3616 domain-containing protein [Anabaena sp. FACHB-709]|uniref:DUF3616 domain-containing protein n=2 Tax=Nostocaceae TaxID=1162 RepID=A0A1Z4KRM3_ANAVA|nr:MULTISPECIES: DUF3616 domain-containing protein [Nostocaceae]BAY71543.1 hypothetical protein NIES23_43630 [Trichormus variabilis NIES-23]HBW31058.1 DUF3616 domain-containing protein [Nostoc sp. UBA8866]MBD2172398.1 DUF3616 domain-containing protein [Anabaena cylindrica FACHB-318]MBD2264134.1 DUF3616 domain-containing protein [Anabaena sp. FACHB-709]MBD2273338.1 DUF3616 domain-containing protein [Nostoc sp. PCC 7120 = FACHB-418]